MKITKELYDDLALTCATMADGMKPGMSFDKFLGTAIGAAKIIKILGKHDPTFDLKAFTARGRELACKLLDARLERDGKGVN